MQYGNADYSDAPEYGTRVVFRRSGEDAENSVNFWNAGSFPHSAQAASFVANLMQGRPEGKVDRFYCTPIKRSA